VTEEEVRVEKKPVVKEEITVGKRRVQETETVRDTVRREEARVEETGAARVREPWRGKERRRRRDSSYAGPERRVVTT
jgi:stress response protein YsnF